MTITAARREEIMKDIAEHNSERLQKALKAVLDNGFLVFSQGKPEQRFSAYMKGTLAAELPLVLDEQYLDKFRAGVVPAFQSFCNMPAMDLMTGMETGMFCQQPLGHPDQIHMPDAPAPFQNMWALLLSLPTEWKDGFIPFRHHQREFRRLYGKFILGLVDEGVV